MSSTSLYQTLQELSGARFTEINHARDVVDFDFLRLARQKGIALPSNRETKRDKFHGGFVLDPRPGRHENVLYTDVSAMYPNIMRQCNMSPETLIGTAEELEKSPYTEDDCVWSYVDMRPVKRLSEDELYSDFVPEEGEDAKYKIIYDPNKNNIKWRDDWESIQRHMEKLYFISPEIQEGFIASRADDYIKWNKSYTGTLYDATKQQRNALYGVNGDTGWRLFEWRVAESVCLAGRIILNYSIDAIQEHIIENSDITETYACLGDTDGFGLTLPTAPTRGIAFDVAEKAVEWINDEGYDDFVSETFGTDEHYTAIEIESYSPTVFVPQTSKGDGVKKTYAKWTTIDEGEECDEISITGFECERSDIADVTDEIQRYILEIILRNDVGTAKETVFPYLREWKDRFHEGDVSLADIGQRAGMSKHCYEYGTPNRRAHPPYRGAKYSHDHIDGENFESGGKPYKFYVSDIGCDDHPSEYQCDTAEDGDDVDVISVEQIRNIPDCATIDYETHWSKTVEQPMRQILYGIGVDWDDVEFGHEQAGFDHFEQ